MGMQVIVKKKRLRTKRSVKNPILINEYARKLKTKDGFVNGYAKGKENLMKNPIAKGGENKRKIKRGKF